MKSLIFIAAGMLACIVLLAVIILLISHYSVKLPSIQNKEVGTVTSPQPAVNCTQFPLATGCRVVDASINICTEQHPNYPLLSDILTTPANRNLGVYSGTITNLNYGLHSITVTSHTNGKPFIFQGESISNVLYDIHHSKINNLNTVHVGINAVISFPCKQQKTGSFILNQFQLVQ